MAGKWCLRADGDARPKVTDRDLDKLCAKAWRAGWALRANGGHVICRPPDGATRAITVAGTPSDHRTLANTKRAFRAAGLADV